MQAMTQLSYLRAWSGTAHQNYQWQTPRPHGTPAQPLLGSWRCWADDDPVSDDDDPVSPWQALGVALPTMVHLPTLNSPTSFWTTLILALQGAGTRPGRFQLLAGATHLA
jgi:hypothetical protein